MKTVDEGLTMNQLAERNAEHVGTIAALEAKCAALMAGIDYLCGEIKQHSESTHFCSRCGEADPSITDDVCRALMQPIPAADAWRAEARAEGVAIAAKMLNTNHPALNQASEALLNYAAKLRNEATR